MKWSIFFVNILLHVGIMALFLTIFFFTIAQYFEKKIIEEQIDFVIDDFVGNSLKPVPKTTKNEIRKEINKAFDKSNSDLNKADESVKNENKKISKKAWTFVGILLSVIAVIVIIFGFIFRWDFYYIKFLFTSSIVSLIFVGITETLFMFLIAQNYLSADPNKIKMSIIQTLYKNRCNPCHNSSHTEDCLGAKMTSCP